MTSSVSSASSSASSTSQTKVGLDACSQLLFLFFLLLPLLLILWVVSYSNINIVGPERAVHARVCTADADDDTADVDDDSTDDDDDVDDGDGCCMAYAPKQYTDNKNKFMKKVFGKFFLKKIVKSMK